jgi:hypothetical protein
MNARMMLAAFLLANMTAQNAGALITDFTH